MTLKIVIFGLSIVILVPEKLIGPRLKPSSCPEGPARVKTVRTANATAMPSGMTLLYTRTLAEWRRAWA